jgi:hypothetical protein
MERGEAIIRAITMSDNHRPGVHRLCRELLADIVGYELPKDLSPVLSLPGTNDIGNHNARGYGRPKRNAA